MRSPDTYLALGIGILLFLSVSLGSAPLVSAPETFPTSTTKLQLTKVLYDYDVVAHWRRIDSSRSVNAVVMNKVEAHIMIDANYASTSAAVIANTRAHATIMSPSNEIVFAGFLTEIGWIPASIDGAWGLSRLQYFTAHWLTEGTYTVTIVYEILIETTWTHVDTATHFMICSGVVPPGYIPPHIPDYIPPGYAPPDIPSEAVLVTWLPLMMSFAVIVGMAFIGFNLTRSSRDPMPGLFMLFTGVTLSWAIGWLDTWIFVTAIAFVAILSAVLWGKVFSKR